MVPQISFQATPVMIGREDAEGQLAFSNGRLVAVLVYLSGAYYEEAENHWHLEAGFGPCAEKRPDPFKTLDEGSHWLAETLRQSTSAAFPQRP